ncbi:hypothetical protein RFI_28706 [Reticulomyxa filosa]|uniref:Uncharacterized protein n=1 Tax=Reticulomyxa filosa TaxID=46433 RepID=X6M6N0_RETFI|nr:hypothetical protein RFI_28706 [Reticulomyxa filosa]|eukprot:ETO08680.1 hypothetical protein RFI_28706 [Reticulomyxa filosa]
MSRSRLSITNAEEIDIERQMQERLISIGYMTKLRVILMFYIGIESKYECKNISHWQKKINSAIMKRKSCKRNSILISVLTRVQFSSDDQMIVSSKIIQELCIHKDITNAQSIAFGHIIEIVHLQFSFGRFTQITKRKKEQKEKKVIPITSKKKIQDTQMLKNLKTNKSVDMEIIPLKMIYDSRICRV